MDILDFYEKNRRKMKNVVENREYISYNKVLSMCHLKALVSPIWPVSQQGSFVLILSLIIISEQ